MFSLRSNRWRYKVLEQKRLEINFSFLARYIHSYRTREIPRAPSLPRLFRYNVTMRLYLSMTRSRICARRKYIPSLFLSFLFSKPYYYVNTWLAQGLVSTRGRFNVVSTHLYNSVYTYKRYVQLNISAWFIELSKNAGSSQSSWRTLILDSYPRATLTHFSLQISVPLLRFFLLLIRSNRMDISGQNG